ncbi:MAG: hypothetical protein KBS81_11020, partial [Spirochaetales bacterium]|nr:hypothetical protein [Candidatus Physcosoma equi]
MIERKDQKTENTWDISALAESPAAWDKAVEALKTRIPSLSAYKGKLGESSDTLYTCLKEQTEFFIEFEKLMSWAFLCYSADSSNPEVMQRAGMANMVEAKVSEELSWFDPELMAIDDEKIEAWLKEERFADYRVSINKTRRMKAHVLSATEEKILSLHSANAGSYQQAFMDI